MIYLSALELDPGAGEVRRLLANPYRVHQKLLNAWDDGTSQRMLYRTEWGRNPPRILVQAPAAADWARAFQPGELAGTPRQKGVELHLQAGQEYRYLLRANPTVRRMRAQHPGGSDPLLGKRVALLREEEQIAWLARKAAACGFALPLLGRREDGEPVYAVEVRDRGEVVGRKPGANGRIVHHCVDFEGRLRVTDVAALLKALEEGIGPAKGFGFGLLSLAPG